MIWLIVLLLLIQIGFNLFVQPLTILATSILGYKTFAVIAIALAAWLISGKRQDENLN